MRKKKYSHGVLAAAESQIPQDILDALSRHGWNVFGVYEVVKQELAREKRAKKESRD